MKPLYFFSGTIVAHYIYINRRRVSGLYTNLCVFFGIKEIAVNTEKNPIEQYVSIQTDRFLKLYEQNECNFNENIDDCFYDTKLLKHELINEKNKLEMIWRSRLLYESTPRGNIIMYYDPYKLGFVYYSDTNTISSSILNAAAMKYCIMYRCRDFFVDNEITPEKAHSPLIELHYIEKKKSKKLKTKDGALLDNSAFAKFKSYSKKTDKVISKNDEKDTIESKLKTEDICKNRFLYMGKTRNISLIQPSIKPENKLNGFQSPYLNDLKGETNLQKNVLSYKDFKLKADT
jgi:hypothetical protein